MLQVLIHEFLGLDIRRAVGDALQHCEGGVALGCRGVAQTDQLLGLLNCSGAAGPLDVETAALQCQRVAQVIAIQLALFPAPRADRAGS